jgi:large subunit ribosomal protein L29
LIVAHVKGSAIREMTADEIRDRVGEVREELFNLRFRNAMKQLDNPLKIREGRREMARLLTALREKEVVEAAADSAGKVTEKS